MALTEGNGGLSAADVAAVMGGNGNNGWGFGGDGAWWLLVLFLFAFNGRGFGGGGNSDYPNVQHGFDQQAVMSGISGLTSAISSGFANAEVSRCNTQAALLQALTGLGSGIADVKYSVATENCADRTLFSEGIRDVISAGNANTQALINSTNAGMKSIMDKICQLELDAKNEKIADLQQQLTMATLRESQTAQTAKILADNAAQTIALEQYLNPTPIPAYTVQNPNCCNNPFTGCGCNG